MSEQIIVHICGPRKDHECDDNGPFMYGLRDGTVTDNEEQVKKEGCSWGSVTCSVCGITAMDRSMWEGE